MSRRPRRLWIVAGSLAVLALGLVLSVVLTLRSDWFREKVRQRIVAEVEKATGGRSEIGAFHFDWKQLRATVDGFVLHGSEPPDAPPLFRADSIAVGLKIVSALRRKVDISYLDVRHPQIDLIVDPDGHTNLPAPKIRRAGKSTVETILDLAIGRFSLQDGAFEVLGRGKTPFDARGRNLRAEFKYDLSGLRYRGTVSAAPADFQWGAYRPVPLDVKLALACEKNRVQVDSGRLATAQSQAEFSGAIESLADFAGAFQYKARVALGEVARTFAWRTQLEGPVLLSGNLRFHSASDYQAAGKLHAAGLLFRPDARFTLRDFTADGAVSIDPRRIEVTGLRLAGVALAALTGAPNRGLEPIPLSGRMESVVLRRKTVDAAGIAMALLGGSFAGRAQLADFERIHVEGEVAGFDVRQMLRVYNGQTVPWDGAASGPVQLSVSLQHASTLRAAARMAISAAGTGAPVQGSIEAAYDASSETLDLGRSFLALPATRADFNGVLGRELRVHAESRNLDEVLPAFGVQTLPVGLRNGQAVFDGTISGKLDDPRITGHATATNVIWSGRIFDALSGDVDLTPAGVSVRNGSLRQGALRAQASGSLGLRDWKAEDASPISAAGSLRNAPVAELLEIAGAKNVPVQGTVTADGKIAGTLGDPRVDASFTAAQGAIGGEPFDRFTGTLHYTGDTAQMAGAQLLAGAREITFQARYQHQHARFDTGRLEFKLDSNGMPVEQFQLVREQVPSAQGRAEAHAAGVLEIAPPQPGQPAFHVVHLNASLDARALQWNGQPLGDASLTAATQGTELVGRLRSDLAGATLTGEGRWSLAGDYPGSAEISFSKVDVPRLRSLLFPGKLPRSVQLTGSAQGALTVSGPALQPDLWKAVLRVPSFEIGPSQPPAGNSQALALRNAAPIVIGMERGVITIESARLQGRATDLALSGTIRTALKNPLDLRVNGRFDLATLQDFNRDIYSQGTAETSATIRGNFSQPQINGRVDIQNATFNLTDLPIGVYKLNGAILFDASRATIQNLTGESGGGTIALSGFAGYSGDALIFHLHAAAEQVRVRYPEDFSTVASASLNLTGSSDSSTLAGTISIVRSGFNPRSDFSSILAASAAPVRTPSAQTGLLANMHFDVQIESAPDITFQSSLAQGIQAEANLRLRGTATNPALLGRINITQGQIVFFGTQFSVNQGSINFYNPVKIEPVLNVDLETKARGVDVILNISGPANKLNLTPRSDPPLQFSEIVALLATGRSPADPTLVVGQNAAPQSFQQLGASALLGQAIASPVTGRLQRFFGVTRLKIDPTLTSLSGVVNTPQARLTVEQQVTPDITFTYITDVTSTNPLVVRVEWAFSRHWSVVALRDENGLFGMEFLYKRRFK